MNFIVAIFYGVIQGLTEFLPVSSSGHSALLPYVLEIKDPGVFFDLSMHMGTALSIIFYFKNEVKEIFQSLLSISRDKVIGKDKERVLSKKEGFTLNMIFATFVTFSFVLVLKGLSESFGRNPALIAFNLIVFGLFMWAADFFIKDKDSHYMEKFDWKRAGAIGAFQGLAIFPGVSRSGGTLTISRLIGLGREEATRFSFLLSLPIICAGFVYKLPEVLRGEEVFSMAPCLFGIFISFVTGLATIHFFLKFIKRVGLGIFSLYRLILGLVIIYLTL